MMIIMIIIIIIIIIFFSRSHYDMMKDVPIVGWDVAFTSDGIFLLEVNLSCNFFKGKFNTSEYIAFVDQYFEKLGEEQLEQNLL
jgi:hypothetical protein